MYFAYFEPYSWDRHLRLLGEVAENPIARVHDIGSTVDERPSLGFNCKSDHEEVSEILEMRLLRSLENEAFSYRTVFRSEDEGDRLVFPIHDDPLSR